MKKKRLSILIMAVLLISLMPMSVFAEVVMIDPFNGDVISGDNPYEDRLVLYTGCSYERSTGMFEYDTASVTKDVVRCSVPDRMITQSPVTIEATEGAGVKVYRDGQLLEDQDLTNLKEIGAYTVMSNIANEEKEVLRFNIVGEAVGNIYSYQIPEGYTLSSVSVDDVNMGLGGNTIDLSQEGHYDISYYCSRLNKYESLSLDVDHTAPTLELIGVENGLAHGPVSLADAEEGSSLFITFNGKAINPTEKLNSTGLYEVVIQDKAGNSTTYEFKISVYFDVKSWVFIALVLAIIIGVTAYILISRRNLRVR